jgi:hypothetical protein
MKIAIICITGPISKWGYQHTHPLCIASQAEFADAVYLVQSTADRTGVDELMAQYPNITLISGPETWTHMPGSADTQPFCNNLAHIHFRNFDIGRRLARLHGYGLILHMHGNWYVPRGGRLREYCEAFYAGGARIGQIWRVFQFGDVLFKPGDSGDFLINCMGQEGRDIAEYEFALRLRYYRRPADAIPSDAAECGIVDCSMELTVDELGRNATRYNDYRLQETGFDFEKILPAYVTKFGKNAVDNRPLDYWGQQIAARTRPDFASYRILQGMGLKPNA